MESTKAKIVLQYKIGPQININMRERKKTSKVKVQISAKVERGIGHRVSAAARKRNNYSSYTKEDQATVLSQYLTSLADLGFSLTSNCRNSLVRH